MRYVTDIAELEAIYGEPSPASLTKVVPELTPLYRKWIMSSRFCIISTVGTEGTDSSPRGDDRSVVREIDAKTLALPDWRGNNRIDTLRNIVEDGRVSLLFMVPGSNVVVRVNGLAKISVDPVLLASFDQNGKHPRSVIIIRIGEIYAQCARAPMRAALWQGEAAPSDLPSMGDLIAEASQGKDGGRDYDAVWPTRARETMW